MDRQDSATARSRKRNGGTQPPASAAAAEECRGRGAAEAAPSESETRLYTTLEEMPDAYAMMSAVRGDAGQLIDFRYDFANAALCSAIGLTRDELSGRRLLELFAGHRHWWVCPTCTAGSS